MAESYVIGVDFGSDSVRALIVNTETGENVGQGVACYPRWKAGLYQHPEYSIFRQHPLDYLESLEKCTGRAYRRAERSCDWNWSGHYWFHSGSGR